MDEIREQNSAEEMIDVYDPQHRRTGRSVRRGEPLEGGERLQHLSSILQVASHFTPI